MSKYTIVKNKIGKSKKVIVEGVKKVLYKKDGSRKMYVVSKGKMMQLTKYKEMKKKKGNVKKVKKRGGVYGDNNSFPRVVYPPPSTQPHNTSFPVVTENPFSQGSLAKKYTRKDYLAKLKELNERKDRLRDQGLDKDKDIEIRNLLIEFNVLIKNYEYLIANMPENADKDAYALFEEYNPPTTPTVLPRVLHGGKKKNKNKPKKVSRKKTRTKK